MMNNFSFSNTNDFDLIQSKWDALKNWGVTVSDEKNDSGDKKKVIKPIQTESVKVGEDELVDEK